MSQKSSLYRTIQILKDLNDGKKLCINTLAIYYEVHPRTIQRDFKLIREIFGNFLSKEKECYQGHKKVLLDELLHASDLMTLSNIINLFEITNKQSLISEKTNALIKNSLSIYDFKSKPFEIIKNKDLLKKLEHAIKFNKELYVDYQANENLIKRRFQPYRIIFLNENFYLVGVNIFKNYFEFLRISLIKDVSYSSKSFYRTKDIEQFIDSIQTPWSKFGVKSKIVRVHISSCIAKYFRLKSYLPTQKILKEFENGDLEIEYRISDFREVEELIIKWLPNIEVVEPLELNEIIREALLKKLEGVKS